MFVGASFRLKRKTGWVTCVSGVTQPEFNKGGSFMESGKSWLRVKLLVDWRLLAALGALLKLLYHFH